MVGCQSCWGSCVAMFGSMASVAGSLYFDCSRANLRLKTKPRTLVAPRGTSQASPAGNLRSRRRLCFSITVFGIGGDARRDSLLGSTSLDSPARGFRGGGAVE